MAMSKETGTKDEHYNLVSTLYHSLQGAETCGMYIMDAEEAGDKELVRFFRDTQKAHQKLAEKAKQMLKSKLS